MEREIFRTRVQELIEDTCTLMKNKIDIVISSGAIDVEAAEDNYLLPKLVLKALLKDSEKEVGLPFSNQEEHRKTIDNICAMI